MKTRLMLLICLVQFCFVSYSQETLEGEFELNKTLNEHLTLNKKEKKIYNFVMDRFDVPFVDNYLATLDRGETKKADSLLKTSKVLSKVPPKAVGVFYTLHQLNQAGLGELYCITLKSALLNGVQAVFLTKAQLAKLKPNLGKKMTLQVKFVTETKGTGIKIYTLIG